VPTVLYAWRGLDVNGHVPRKLADDLVGASEVVIRMGCGETCPVQDPAGEDLETVRRIVGDIDTRVRALVAEMETA
jgi:arsenate reductase